METSNTKTCPLSARPCKENSCAWWHGLAEDCAVVLLAGILADSDVCRTRFEERGAND